MRRVADHSNSYVNQLFKYRPNKFDIEILQVVNFISVVLLAFFKFPANA